MSDRDQEIMNAWAIINDRTGLYCGTFSTRNLAIAEHVRCYDEELYDARRYWSGPLSERQKKVWRSRKKIGDHAVRVIVATVAPTASRKVLA